jgi:hypothetical protein
VRWLWLTLQIGYWACFILIRSAFGKWSGEIDSNVEIIGSLDVS